MANKLISGTLATLPRSTTGPVAVVFTNGDPVLLYDNEDRFRYQMETMASKPPNTLMQASGDLKRAMMSSPILAANGGTEVALMSVLQLTMIGPSDDIDVYHVGKSTALRHLWTVFHEVRSEDERGARTGAQLNEIAVAIAHHVWPGTTTAEARSARMRQGLVETAERMQQFATQLRSNPDRLEASELLGLAAFRTLTQAKNRDGKVPEEIPVAGHLDMTSLRKVDGELRAVFKTELGEVPVAIPFAQSAILQTRGADQLTLQCQPRAQGRVGVISIA